MLLLLLHFLQHGLLLELDQIPPLGLAEAQPKFFDPLTLLLARITPELVLVLCRGGRGGRGIIGRGCGGRPVRRARRVLCGGSRSGSTVRPDWVGGSGGRRGQVCAVDGLLSCRP
jgi:hypothetical protein